MSYSDDTVLVLGFILVTVLGLAFFFIGRVWKAPHYSLFSGIVILFGSLFVYAELGPSWAVLGLGLAFILMYEGVLAIVEA